MTLSNGQPGQDPGGSTTEQSSPQQPDWAGFATSIENMGATLSERLTQELGGRLDSLRQTVLDGTPEPVPVDPDAGFDFDAASPRQLHDHLMNKFSTMMEATIQQVMEQALTPYAEQITGLRRDMVTDQGSREIERLQSSNKDFADWVPEMKDLARKHPSLSITEVFSLAKGSNPQKASELNTKYNPPPPPPTRPFSLGPSSGGRDAPGAPAKMTKQEAVMDAYRQVSERHPGVLAALDDAFPLV